MKRIGIGLIGTGFMGKAHALAYGSVRAVMGDVPTPHLAVLCDTPIDMARKMARQFGFADVTDDWRSLVKHPSVDIVAITAPNNLHYEMALAAIGAGKHVHCEKPLSLTVDQATEMANAAKLASVKTMVGYNYIHNPAFTHAQRLIANGAIGKSYIFMAGWTKIIKPIPICIGHGAQKSLMRDWVRLVILPVIWCRWPTELQVQSKA